MSDSKYEELGDAVAHNVEGWGPVNGAPLSIFNDVPYAHFDKKERIWRTADFTSGSYNYRQNYKGRYGDANLDFTYKHDNVEDSTFQLVDTIKSNTKKTVGGTKRNQWQNSTRIQNRIQQPGRGGGRGPQVSFGGRGGRGGRGRGNRQNNRRNDRKSDRLPSLVVGPDWEMIAEFDHSQLLKLQANPPKAQDLVWCGHLNQYDETYDKITTRTAKSLRRIDNRIFYSVTTSDDPILEKYAAEGMGTVFASDAILAQLMAAPRAIYSWDLVINKNNGITYIDKRDNSIFDYLTVSETAHDPPQAGEGIDEINHPDKLSLEATMINQNFSQQVLVEPTETDSRKIYEPNPFYDEDEPGEPASAAYRYRQFALGTTNLVVRTELHSWLNKRGEDQYINTYALNEWDSKYSGGILWRQKIDQQRGAVLATELKNNSCKLAKWTAQSILSGADNMKLGYVSRATPTNQFDHQILATQFFKPKDLAQQINLSINNCWGIVKMLCDLVQSKDDGKYVLMKDPNKNTLRMYSVPANALEEDEEEEFGDDNAKEGENDM